MPSISGIRMSVSSRSKRPPSRVTMSSASAPSTAVTTSWPASVSARAVSARNGSSSSAMRMRAMISSCRDAGWNRYPLSIVELLNHADERQLPERVRDVHAVADHEQVRADEADEIRVERNRALAGLFQQHAGEHAPGAARREQVLGVGERAAGFEDVVDQQHVAAAHLALDVVQHRHGAGRDRAVAIARQRNEFDLRREARGVQRADQVGREDEAALEHGDDQQILRRRRLDLLRQSLIARRDRLGVEQHADFRVGRNAQAILTSRGRHRAG